MAGLDLETALQIKLRGNERFKENQYETAIDLYSEAIAACPPHRRVELAVIFQNRAAAHERLDRLQESLQDCDESIKLNNRYGKSLDRRSKIHKKIATGYGRDELIGKISHLRQAMEDVSMAAQLEGLKHEQLLFVDETLKHLGSALAVSAAKTREPTLPSAHTIVQYFTSFMEDPLFDDAVAEGGYGRAKQCYEAGQYEAVVPCCEEEISITGPDCLRAKLLKATFLVLQKQLDTGMALLTQVIEAAGEQPLIKVNALVKRGAVYIQRCQDPQQDAELSYADFNLAAQIRPESADVLMNRGQIHLLLDNFPAAVEDLRRAAELRPDFALAAVQSLYTDFLAAQTAKDTGKAEAAVEGFRLAVEKFPSCVEAHALYAKVLQETDKLEEADAQYKRGTELNPDNANLIVHRALLALQRFGDVAATMAEIDRAIQIDDRCEFAYETAGQIEIQRENLAAAVAAFDKAIPLVNTELEMAHLFGLRESGQAKLSARRKLMDLPSGLQELGLD